MIQRLYNFERGIGLTFYDIPSLVLLAIIIIMCIVHWRNHKKREKNYEEKLKQEQNGDNVDTSGNVID